MTMTQQPHSGSSARSNKVFKLMAFARRLTRAVAGMPNSVQLIARHDSASQTMASLSRSSLFRR